VAAARAQPDYPPIAKPTRVGGRVELEFTIESDGSVGDERVLSGRQLLVPAAIDALKKWKFKPFTESGAPVKAITSLGFDFKL
jgi:protein TonB